mmetsp:Transcript_6470/g.24417  ORF Transcript_6470/g.24417 Transcript_6470/m.24417 type:complete len:266 (+) Transcript_6470:756-1553(+)
MLLGHTRSKPRSAARAWRSTPNGFPASAPLPSGSVFTRGAKSAIRMSSRCHAAACDSSQCDHRTVCADCRCVNPGITTSTSRSARSHATVMSSRRYPRSVTSRVRSHILVSVATWSFRDLPVCSFPATDPITSPSLRSFAVWMSSSPSLTSNVSASHSLPTIVKPATSASLSSSVIMPVFASARAYPMLPRMSSCAMRRSKDNDSLNFSINGSMSSLNRPPQSFFFSAAIAMTSDLARGRAVTGETRRSTRALRRGRGDTREDVA